MPLEGMVEAAAGEESLAEGTEDGRGQNLGEDVGKHVGSRNMAEDDGLGGDLVTQPPHAHGKVPVAGRDNRIGRHFDASLVVFVHHDSGGGHGKEFGKHAREPECRLAGLHSCEVFRLRSAEAHHGRHLRSPHHRAAIDTDDVTIARTGLRGVCPGGIDVRGYDGDRRGGVGEDQNVIRCGEKVTEDTERRIPVGLGRVNGFAADEAYSNSDVRAGHGDPEERTSEREVPVAHGEKWAGVVRHDAGSDRRGCGVSLQLAKFRSEVPHKLVLVDADDMRLAGQKEANHVCRYSKVRDGVGGAKAICKPGKFTGVRRDSKDVVDDDRQNDDATTTEPLAVDTRIVFGATEPKFGEAGIKVAVPQQWCLLQTIHTE